MDVHNGDRVQIKAGAIDVTNGRRARYGEMYCEGNRLWLTVQFVDTEYLTGQKWGLPPKVTRVCCIDNSGRQLWQVQPQHICDNVIVAKENTQTKSTFVPMDYNPTEVGKSELNTDYNNYMEDVRNPLVRVNSYATKSRSDNWVSGITTHRNTPKKMKEGLSLTSQIVSGSALSASTTPSYIPHK